jgi:hypothetical protein
LSLAKELGKTLAEVNEIPEAELRLWMAYAEWENERLKNG